MAFPGSIYAPPGVYTQTNFESPVQGIAANLRVPVFIGTGNQILSQANLEVVRGSSASVDQRVVDEDMTGRAIVSISPSGSVTLGAFDATRDRVQVRHYPIVTGAGTGTVATDTSAVSVTINGSPVVVLSMNANLGILKLSVAPELGDDVRVTYYFDRTDTQITDDVSEQVTSDAPVIYGQVGQNYTITTGVNDTLIFTVDEADEVVAVISASPVGGWNAAQLAAFINNAATGTSLTASTAINNFGATVLLLTADRDITVGNGTANSVVGFSNGDSTARNRVFYTFQQPIVDGSGGGVTTTDPSDVTVKVDGVQVIPTAVDGQTGAVTLPFAPEIGATVTIQYYFNSWQDTFDYLANRGITDITLCGVAPDRSDYIEGTDFVLKDDKILWGTAVLTSSGVHTTGSTFFNETQVSPTLVDVRQYLAPCTTVNATTFQLPLQPTTGNGRDTPLGVATFNKVANGRIDLPTNRPDLVYAYWGFSVNDALERGRVVVTKVDSATSTITLAEPVPTDATVFATFYYNTIVDQTYAVECITPGASGVGTYTIKNADGLSVFTPKFGTKSAGLSTITVEFPSGAEQTADCRLEIPFATTDYSGPVEEDVTVTFAAQDVTLAEFTVPSSGPYYPVRNESDNLQIAIDGTSVTTDLSDPTGNGTGFPAFYSGEIVQYDAASGHLKFDITNANNSVDLMIDGQLIQTETNVGYLDLEAARSAINWETWGIYNLTPALGGVDTIQLEGSIFSSDQNDYYNGWIIKITSGLAAGDKRTVTDYNGTTRVATVNAPWSGAIAPLDGYYLYNPVTRPKMRGTTRFVSGVDLSNGFFTLNLNYIGSATGNTPLVCSIAAVNYGSVASLVTGIQTAVDAAILVAFGVNNLLEIEVSADTSGRIVLALFRHPLDISSANLEVVEDATPADDFAILAGFDIDVAGGVQAKIDDCRVAYRPKEFYGPTTGQLNYDRLILRNRLIPGQSTDGQSVLDQTEVKVLGGTGASLFGLVPNEQGYAGIRGTIMPPTLYGEVGLSGGQSAVNGQPLIRFYAAGGTNPQNNIFKMTFEGTPITVEFTDDTGAAIPSGGFADVPLGRAVTANTVLNQIRTALTAAGFPATSVRQEGAGIRFRGQSSAASASIVIGDGNANDVLGFSDDETAFRTVVRTELLVSALMSDPNFLLGFTGAIAKSVKDNANATYLYIQETGNAVGGGPASSIYFEDAATDNALRPGVGLGVVAGDGNSGESAIDGFYVTSSDFVNGSGSANTSALNTGTGQDGNVGQTYRDAVTGLTFTVLPRAGNVAYPSGQYFTFTVRKNVTADSNIPVNSIPGVQLVVANTLGVAVGDTAVVETFEKGGNQPAVGDFYYVSYLYTKQDYNTALYTKLSAIEAAYGANTPLNPVTMASYLAILNGAVLVGIKQVQKDTDVDGDGVADVASESAYIAAIDDLEGVLPGGIAPDILTVLKGDSLSLFQYLAKHCDIQSSIRYRAERTAVVGVSAGTQPAQAGAIAQAVARTRFRLVYPDIANLTLSRADGATDTYLVDGTFLASALIGSLVSPTTDVATPWTGRRLFGFDRLARILDAVQQNQVAVKGVTVLEDRTPVIRVRQGLSSDMTNVLTRTPTVITIADEVQQQTRVTLDRFIGIKFLPGVTSQIEGQVSNTLKQLVAAQIITAYTGVKAKVSENDPTVAEVEAYYQPVFPLLYIVVTFNLRSSL